MSLLDRRLLVVTGKGGTGKTTVCAAIGLAAARSGRRTLVIELAGQHRLASLFNGEAPPDGSGEVALYPGLTGLSLDPQRALEEYLALVIPVRALAERLSRSRAFSYLAAAAPGLRELVTLGKVWHLTEATTRAGEARHPLIVVDAPATGHALAMLNAPRAWADVARAGRINQEAAAIAGLVSDPRRTGVVLVSLAEEIPVAETIEADAELRRGGLLPAAVVVNAVYPPTLASRDRLGLLEPASAVARAATAAARSHLARRLEHEAEVARLAAAVATPQVELPFLFRPQIDLDAISELSRLIGPAFEATA